MSLTDVAITIADGTYIYIEKCGDHFLKAIIFGAQIIIVATDAFILTVLGHFLVEGK